MNKAADMHGTDRIRMIGLILLLGVGLVGGFVVSWKHAFGGEPCPVLGETVPACYIALGSYLMMTIGVGVRLAGRDVGQILFYSGLVIAGGLALLASLFELLKGDICPSMFGWLPMCYLSLAVSVTIGYLYVIMLRQNDALAEPVG